LTINKTKTVTFILIKEKQIRRAPTSNHEGGVAISGLVTFYFPWYVQNLYLHMSTRLHAELWMVQTWIETCTPFDRKLTVMLHLRGFLTDLTLWADVEARIAGVKWKELAQEKSGPLERKYAEKLSPSLARKINCPICSSLQSTADGEYWLFLRTGGGTRRGPCVYQ
jgi:hypothetical protein